MSEKEKPQTFTQPLRQACDPHVGAGGETITPKPATPAESTSASVAHEPAPAEEA